MSNKQLAITARLRSLPGVFGINSLTHSTFLFKSQQFKARMKKHKEVYEHFLVAIEPSSDLNLVESGTSDNFKLRIFSFSGRCY